MTIISVVGARPNFMKVAPLARAFQRYPDVRHRIVHTGQHYDAAMSDVFFRDLDIPEPDLFLGIGSGSHAQQTAKVMTAFEEVVHNMKPDAVVVVGDVNSTLACSLVCAKMGIPVAHIEAGLRSFDRTMPEEINRLVTDAIADWLFVSEPSGVENLKREGVAEEKVFFVGNVMIDTLIDSRRQGGHSAILDTLGVQGREFVLTTLHRPSNVDTRERLACCLGLLQHIAARMPVVFPMHPRTKKMIDSFDLAALVPASCIVTEPLGYVDFMTLMAASRCVVTDSGGIQEESTYLGIPCITLRANTERPVTVTEGTNILVGEGIEAALDAVETVLSGTSKPGRIPSLWDGHAAERIAERLIGLLASRCS